MNSRTLLPILSLALLMLAAPAVALSPMAVPGWAQVNSDGFGDARNAIGPLAVFNGTLYAGTWSNATDHPAQVWRAADGKHWSEFSPPWSDTTESAYDLAVFDGRLYVGVDRTDSAGGEVWRTDGNDWEASATAGFGNAQNIGINALTVFSATLYAVTTNPTTGPEIWRSATGDSGDWQHVAADLSNGPATQDVVLEELAGQLFLGLGREQAPGRFLGELWRSSDGQTWTPVFTDGLGNSNNSIVSALTEFDGYLYLGFRNISEGGEVWRSLDGENWSRVLAGGLGNRANSRPYGLFVFQDHLYLVFSNTSTGAEVWRLRSSDDTTWIPVVTGGWGDANNGYADYFDKGAAVFEGRLYLGTLNRVTGGEVWLQLDHRQHLPLVVH